MEPIEINYNEEWYEPDFDDDDDYEESDDPAEIADRLRIMDEWTR